MICAAPFDALYSHEETGNAAGRTGWPLVELEVATRAAKARVHALRAQPEVRAAKAAIVERHGSRKRPEGRRRKAAASAGSAAQLDLEF
ncbi:MAG: hypothetical protein RBT67_14680 [Thauera sp.]|nr:hypothetical protein [Thauera sp.]